MRALQIKRRPHKRDQMSNTHRHTHRQAPHAFLFCIWMLLLSVSVPVSCVLLCLPPTPTPSCLFSKKSYERCKCIRRYAFPYSHPLRIARCGASSFSFSYSIFISILCSSSTYRRVYLLGAPSSLTATSATASHSLCLAHTYCLHAAGR